MYLIALLCPPLAVLMTGRLFGAMLCVPLSLFYFPGALYAILVVSDHKARKRMDEMARVIGLNTAGAIGAAQANAARVALQARGKSTSLVDEILAERRAEVARLEQERDAANAAFLRSLPMRFLWAVDRFRLGSIRSYHSLPEWAQPVTWGWRRGPLSHWSRPLS